MAAELADEWVEYAEAACLQGGSLQNYCQAIDNWCTSLDDRLGEDAGRASLGSESPDLSRDLATWERCLPSGFAAGSMRPTVLAGAVRILIRRRSEHPDRPVTAAVARFARASSGVPQGETNELDEFSRKDKQALVRGAWSAVIVLERRLVVGWALAEQGQHPDDGSWEAISDLLWGLSREVITPADIHAHLPVARSWPVHLREVVERQDGSLPTTAKQKLDRWLIAQLYPTTLDLQAFRVLLMDATGHAPEEVSGLSENGVEFLPGGVRLELVKKRAQRRYYRSFRDQPEHRAGVVETNDFPDRPRRETSVIVRRLMEVTARTRGRAADPERRLFVRAAVDVDLTVTFGAWRPDAPGGRFSDWLSHHDITVVGPQEIRRLRKSTKVEKAVVAGGRISGAADDHHEETFRGHYAQGTTLRVISGEVINAAQQHWFATALTGPTVVHSEAVDALRDPERCDAMGLTDQEADNLMQGQLDMGVTHCKNPYDSPYGPAGQLCAVAPLRCLECRNAWVLPSQLPQLLLFQEHLENLRRRLTPRHFTSLWGQSYVNLQAVLADRSEEEKALARQHISETDTTLGLPLFAHVEFDA